MSVDKKRMKIIVKTKFPYIFTELNRKFKQKYYLTTMRKTYKPLLPPVAFIFCLFWVSCQNPANYNTTKSNTVQRIVGQTMGTTYTVKYHGSKQASLQTSIDSFLQVFNQSASTYIPNSSISLFNQQSHLELKDDYLIALLEYSKRIYQETEGAFDPTVMPLVNYWKFGYEQNIDPSKVSIDSLLSLVGFDKISWTNEETPTINKEHPDTELDFSAIAKGYGVDLIGELLEQKGIDAYLVEIGGEMRAKGQKPDGQYWKVGIDRPIDSLKIRQKAAIISLKNRAIATSGNYRNFYIKDGQKVAHTINPKTGYSELSNLLSTTILAPTCIEADAYATAMMVMGLEKSKAFAENHPSLGVLLIYADEAGNLQTWESGETGRVD